MTNPPGDRVAFRLPVQVVRRNFVLHTSIIVGALFAFHLASGQSSLSAVTGAASLAALMLAIAYIFAASRVWFTLSASGVATTGFTGRKHELSWATPVALSSMRKSGYKGHMLVLQGVGFLRGSTSSVFVPEAIASSSKFASAVEAWAPPAHPLRGLAKNAA